MYFSSNVHYEFTAMDIVYVPFLVKSIYWPCMSCCPFHVKFIYWSQIKFIYMICGIWNRHQAVKELVAYWL